MSCISITSWDTDLAVSSLPLPSFFFPVFIKHGSHVSLSGLYYDHYFKLGDSHRAVGCNFRFEISREGPATKENQQWGFLSLRSSVSCGTYTTGHSSGHKVSAWERAPSGLNAGSCRGSHPARDSG